MNKLLKTAAPFLLLILIAVGISGCEQISDLTGDPGQVTDSSADSNTHSTAIGDRGQSLADYFDGQTVNFYRQTNSSTVTCESGACPATTDIPEYMMNEECFFCASGSEVYVDRVVVHISPASTSDSFGGCTKKSVFTWPQELAIVEKNEDIIIARGSGSGHVKQTGSTCDSYTYNFTTEETWIFTTQKLEDLVTMEIYTGAPRSTSRITPTYYIDALGWDNPPTEPLQYSHFGITIIISSPYDFRVIPEIRLVRIEGHRLNTSVLKMKTTEPYENATQFNFAASFDADYVVVPVLKVIGKNGTILREIIGTSEYIIRVTDSPQGDLPN